MGNSWEDRLDRLAECAGIIQEQVASIASDIREYWPMMDALESAGIYGHTQGLNECITRTSGPYTNNRLWRFDDRRRSGVADWVTTEELDGEHYMVDVSGCTTLIVGPYSEAV